MKLFLRIIVLLIIILVIRMALEEKGEPYHPIKDGMEHNTSGDEWPEAERKKKKP